MLVLKDLVVPVDFESASYCALEYARELAVVFGARLHLLHVQEDVSPLRATDSQISAFPMKEAEIRERLNQLLTNDEREAGAVTVVRASPDPGTAIVAYAEQVDASFFPDIDTRLPVYPIRGSLLRYNCDREGRNVAWGRADPGANCVSFLEANASGHCYKTTAGVWSCSMSDLVTQKTEKVAPPK